MDDRSFFSCIIPAYNEEKTIGLVIKAALQHPLIKEVIVISDGSTDQTKDIAITCGAHTVIQLEKNIGKGGAVLKGVSYSKYDNLLLLDADLINLTINHIDALIKPLIENNEIVMSIGILPNQLLPYLSGQRALRKFLIKNIHEDLINNSKYGLEIILSNYVKKNQYKTVFVNLNDIHFLRTFAKFSFIKSLQLELKFIKDLLRILLLLFFLKLK
ncbi:MAG: hypothetical protein KatS3mg097_592 [Candidatus Parcubacteria bacterium]|nr:MAG: hypothetical protein KatS3mg097_592 [Candidatus Parcubacteria bacterium]